MAGWLRYTEVCPLLTQHGRTLCYISSKGEVSKDDVAAFLGLGVQMTNRILGELQSEGLVTHEKVGKNSVVWRLTGSQMEAVNRLVRDEGVGRGETARVTS